MYDPKNGGWNNDADGWNDGLKGLHWAFIGDPYDFTILNRRRYEDGRNIMKVAIAEMLYCADIPHLVSIDEAIEISKDFSDERSGVFINGILNGIKNEIEQNASGGRME